MKKWSHVRYQVILWGASAIRNTLSSISSGLHTYTCELQSILHDTLHDTLRDTLRNNYKIAFRDLIVCALGGKPSFSTRTQANEKWRRKSQSEQELGASATFEQNALDVTGHM